MRRAAIDVGFLSALDPPKHGRDLLLVKELAQLGKDIAAFLGAGIKPVGKDKV